MLIPYNTDAPIYHFPYTSIGLIVVNTLVFFVTAQAEPENVIPWILIFGDGLHPLQWLSTNFLHADFLHLLGNMFYLWGFGLVVEGKLGWWRFLLLYLAIGIMYGAIVQIVMLGSEGGALGASGVIFGLLAISLVWAPKNEINCWLLLGFFVRQIDVSIVVFSLLYIAIELALAWFDSFRMSSQMLHLAGAAIGFAWGVALLKFDLVDCEGWDLYTVWQGRQGELPKEKPVPRASAAAAVETSKTELGPVRAKILVNGIRSQLLNDDAQAAGSSYHTYREQHPQWVLEEPDLLALIKSLHQGQHWKISLRPMIDYIRQFPAAATRMRLKLAQILIVHEHRPVKALEVLGKIPAEQLPPDLQAVHTKLTLSAEELADTAELEVADEEMP